MGGLLTDFLHQLDPTASNTAASNILRKVPIVGEAAFQIGYNIIPSRVKTSQTPVNMPPDNSGLSQYNTGATPKQNSALVPVIGLAAAGLLAAFFL